MVVVVFFFGGTFPNTVFTKGEKDAMEQRTSTIFLNEKKNCGVPADTRISKHNGIRVIPSGPNCTSATATEPIRNEKAIISLLGPGDSAISNNNNNNNNNMVQTNKIVFHIRISNTNNSPITTTTTIEVNNRNNEVTTTSGDKISQIVKPNAIPPIAFVDPSAEFWAYKRIKRRGGRRLPEPIPGDTEKTPYVSEYMKVRNTLRDLLGEVKSMDLEARINEHNFLNWVDYRISECSLFHLRKGARSVLKLELESGCTLDTAINDIARRLHQTFLLSKNNSKERTNSKSDTDEPADIVRPVAIKSTKTIQRLCLTRPYRSMPYSTQGRKPLQELDPLIGSFQSAFKPTKRHLPQKLRRTTRV